MIDKRMVELPALLTVKQMAEFLSIGIGEAYQIINKKHIEVLRIGPKKIRVPRYELINWVKNNMSKPSKE